MSATILQQAAAILRTRAENATPDPWQWVRNDWLAGGERAWDDVIAPGPVSCSAYCYGGISRLDATPENRAYLTLAAPELGIAIADWLDAAAADEWAHGPRCLTPCEDCDDDPRAAHVRRALAVATVVLAASGTESLRSETP